MRLARAVSAGPLLALVLAPAAPAQERRDAPPPPARPVTWTLAADRSYRFAGDLDGSPGQAAVTQTGVALDAGLPVGHADLLKLSAAGDLLHYRFSGGAGLLPGAPDLFDDVFAIRAGATYTHAFDGDWTGVANASYGLQFASGADLGGSGAPAWALGGLCRCSPDLTAGLLLAYWGRIEENPYVFPFPVVEWKLAPGAALRTEQRGGLGYALAFDLDAEGRWTLGPRFRYSIRRFRLRDGGILPDGVVDDSRAALDLGLRCRSGPFTLDAFAGADVWQEFTVKDRDGNDRASVETRPQPFVGLTLKLAF